MARSKLILPGLFILIAPLGAAAQNTLLGLAFLSGCICLFRQENARNTLKSLLQDRQIAAFVGMFLTYLFAMACSGFINAIPSAKIFEFLLGYLPVVLIPLLAASVWKRLDHEWQPLRKLLAIVLSVMAIVCLTQFLFGWRRAGFGIEVTEFRARGFYSHPLTLAYALLLIWPLCCRNFLTHMRERSAQLSFIANAVMSFTAKSRITLILVIANLAWNCTTALSKKTRRYALALLTVFVVAICIVPNPVRDNFIATMEGRADRHALEYPDDRIAFWHAHWKLLSEHPWIGWGPHFAKEIRYEAYDAIGLAHFSKKYAAHNAFLEIAVSGGLLSLALFLGWIVTILALIRRQRDDASRTIAKQTVLLFCLGVLTQNAFQDNEVRFVLTILLTAMLLNVRTQALE